MKRILFFLLVLLSAMGLYAYDFKYGDLCYEITSSNTVVVAGRKNSSTCYEGLSVTIPVSVTYNSKTYNVTSIGDFSDCTGLTSVAIPNGVTRICEGAFNGCTGLISITIPNSVTEIGDRAFYGCTSLTSVTIPNGVTSIGWWTFYGCSGLTSITIGNSVTSIGEGAFYGCTGLASITIPNSVTSIGEEAFHECTGLTSITIGNSVTSIGEGAFYGCTKLCKVNYTGNVKGWLNIDLVDNPISYSKNLYLNDVLLTDLTIPEGVTYISKAFAEDICLTSITIPNSVTSIGWDAFSGCTGLTSITIPNGVTSIGSGAFKGCTGLSSTTIPNSVTRIGEYAFWGCTGLTSITIPNSVTWIGEYAFWGCTGLTSITIPDSVTSIERWAFGYCDGLTSVSIGNSVTSIRDWAFYDCAGLASITIPDSVTSIGWDAFSGCTGLSSIIVKRGNPKYDSRDDCNALIITATNTLLQGCKNTVIPNSVTSIGEDAFRGCDDITSITIPESVTSIGNYAFGYCDNLTTIVWNAKSYRKFNYRVFEGTRTHITSFILGDAVDTIPAYLCYGMNNLVSITIPNNVTSIGKGAFNGCTGLTSIIWNAKAYQDFADSSNHPFTNIRSQITSFAFGDSVSHIPAYLCYYKKRLTSITIPNGVTDIGNNAFCGCDSLSSIVWNAKKCSWKSNESPFYSVRAKIQSFTIGKDVESIPSNLCYGMSNIDSIAIPDRVKNIGRGAFLGCDSLSSIVVNGDNTTYDSRDNCNALIETKTNTLLFGCKNTIIPHSVITIADSALCAYSDKSIITIPASVTHIGARAFGDGLGVDTLFLLPETPPVINNNDLFANSVYKKCVLSVPCGTTKAYRNADGWSEFYKVVEPLPQYTIEVKTQNSAIGTAYVEQVNLCYNDSATIIAKPNFGYHFTQWHDGNTDNPRVVAVTQDTTLTAMFALTTKGECGKSLTWEYTASKLRITGVADMYHYYNTDQPWALLKDSITVVEIADKVTSISSYAFSNCKNLKKITFPATLTAIGSLALEGCSSLTTVVWNVKKMADFSANNTPFYYYSDSSHDNFDIRSQITSFTFGNEVENIPAYLCQGQKSLTSIVVPNSVATIGDYAFVGCTGVVSLIIPNSVTTIGSGVFMGCKNMETISFGAGLTSMGDYALDGCQSIYEMTCYATKVPTVSSNTFREVSTRADLYVPSVSVKKYKTHAYWGVFNVLSIEADPVSSGGNVTVRPGENDVIITWPTDDNADTYSIQITKDGQVFCTLVFNADGQLTNIAFAPARNGAAHSNPRAVLTQAGYRFTVTGLSSGTHYAYDLTVKDYDDTVLQSYTGTFTTKGENITTDLDNIEDSDPNGDNLSGNDTPRKVFCDGQVYIIRGGKTYTTTGMEIK